MSHSNLIFEAKRQASGNFVCETAPVVQERHHSQQKTTTEQNCEGYKQQKDLNNDADQAAQNTADKQEYYIDPQLMFNVRSPWANTENTLFQQTFESNLAGNYSHYYQQMLQQFEQMRTILNAQLSRSINRE